MQRKSVFYYLLIFLFSSQASLANLIGSAAQNFNPDYGERNYITVHSTDTVSKYHLNVSLFADYSRKTLPVYTSFNGADIGDSAIYTSFGLGFGLTDNWDIGLNLPYILNQQVENSVAQGSFVKTGLTEIRFGTKYKLKDIKDGLGIAFLASLGINKTLESPFAGIDPDPSITLEIAVDKQINKLRLAGNLGYRILSPGARPSGFTDFDPLGNSILASVGANYLFNTTWLGIAEVWMGLPDADLSANERDELSLELLLGGMYKKSYQSSEELSISFGVTREINHGISTPEIRGYAGIRYMFGPVFPVSSWRGSSTKAQKTDYKEPAPVKAVVDKSYYNYGFRYGFRSSMGLGKYPYSGKEHGQNISTKRDFPEGFWDGYLEAEKERKDLSGLDLDAPIERKEALDLDLYSKAYREGYVGSFGFGPGANTDKNYGSNIIPDRKYPKGFYDGWVDGLKTKAKMPAPQIEEVEEPQMIQMPVVEEPKEEVVTTITDNNFTFAQRDKNKLPTTEKLNFENIRFKTNSDIILNQSYPILDKLLAYLNKYEFNNLEIWGHTDSRGKQMYNEVLSLKRAKSVYRYLARKGIPESKMEYNGMGERKPLVPNTTQANLYKNRRVEFIIKRSTQQ